MSLEIDGLGNVPGITKRTTVPQQTTETDAILSATPKTNTDETDFSKTPAVEDPEAAARAQKEQRNLALTQKEDSQIAALKKEYTAITKKYPRGDFPALEMVKMSEITDQIRKIEIGRLQEDRFDEKSTKIFNLVNRTLNGESAEAMQDDFSKLTSQELTEYHKTIDYLNEIPEKDRQGIPETFVRFAVKNAQGAYRAYNKETRHVKREIFDKAGGYAYQGEYYALDNPDKELLQEYYNDLKNGPDSLSNDARKMAQELTSFDPATGKRLQRRHN